ARDQPVAEVPVRVERGSFSYRTGRGPGVRRHDDTLVRAGDTSGRRPDAESVGDRGRFLAARELFDVHVAPGHDSDARYEPRRAEHVPDPRVREVDLHPPTVEM